MPEFRFESERPTGADGRPSLTDDLAGGSARLGQAEEIDDQHSTEDDARVVRLLSRRSFVPRLRLPRFIARRLPELPPEVAYRLRVVTAIAQMALMVIFGTLCLALGAKLIFGMSFSEPRSGKEVMQRIDDPRDVSLNVETVRTKNVDGVELRHDTVRGQAVNFGNGAFQLQVNGLAAEEFRVVGDGRTAVLMDRAQPRKLSRYPSPDATRPLLPSDVAEHVSDIRDSRYTAFSQRAWLVTWTPDRDDLLRLLAVDLLDLTGEDVDDLRDGRFRVINGSAVVLRREKRLYQLHVVLEVNDARLEILATYRQQNKHLLDDFDLDESD